MTGKHVALLLCGIIIIPLITFGAFLIAGTKIPIGTFNAVERRKQEAKRHEQKASNSEPRKNVRIGSESDTKSTVNSGIGPAEEEYIVGGINSAGTVHVNRFA